MGYFPCVESIFHFLYYVSEENQNIFLMSDLSGYTNSILAYEQIITWEGVVLYWCMTPRLHQGHFKVKLAKNIENIHFLSVKLMHGCHHVLICLL